MKLIQKILHFSRRFTEQDELSKTLNDLGLKNNLMIFDVGAHKGQTSLHFCKLFPQSFIHAFEPSPYLFAEIEKNLSKKKNIRCHNFALGETNEKAFLTKPNSDLCGQVIKAQEKNSTSISVRRLDEFCQVEKIDSIDLLKIDVEGNELSVLRGVSGMFERNAIRAILLECDFNKDDKQHSYFIDIFDFLSDQNFCFHGLFDVVRYSPSYGIGFCNALFLNRSVFS
ncbi:FkbM family methyltransferase [Opitutales bacterium]|nr:FkbM family methyltransferase [Opitutales bacterium]MDA8989593.1 FkbM family methyltransferase [Opitutales bacterium]MDC0363453.1 FkbM family methyltransferase [Opitutales bacterium]MDC0646767.1 FkbM family methyltransferase [Opitutales bacterium]